MTHAGAIPVETVASYARKAGGYVRIILDVPEVSVAEGARSVRLRRRGQTVWPETTVEQTERGVRFMARLEAATVIPGVWRIAIRTVDSEDMTRVQARLVVGRSQPIALLTGPVPRTEMDLPVPRQSSGSRPSGAQRMTVRMAAKALSLLPEDTAVTARARLAKVLPRNHR